MIFSSPKYIIRLDDANHYSNLDRWIKIEKILNKYSVKPIVAVVPNNMDPMLKYSSLNNNFWSLIKKWEQSGWSIAMHGYNHVYHECKRFRLIFPFYNRSEFGGLSIDSQILKLKKSNKIFTRNGILPKIWIAPSHSFDLNTLKALKAATDIEIISDGIAYSNYFFQGFHFIPQQLWEFKNKLFGLWTICLHPDTMTDKEISELESFLEDKDKKNQIISVKSISYTKKGKTFFGKIFSIIFWLKYECKLFLKQILK